MDIRGSVVAVIGALFLAGCGGDVVTGSNDDGAGVDPSASLDRDDDRGEPGEPVPETEDGAVTGEVPGDLLRPVLADAADRLGTTEIEVTRAEFVEWPDGSLGCPEPGMVYPQVITPGYRVEIRAGGRSLDYRLDTRGFFTLCESPATPGQAP